MLELQIKTPLRFYTDLSMQNRYKSYCKGECDYGLKFPKETTVHGALPFMFEIPLTAGDIQGFIFIGTCDPFISVAIDTSLVKLQSFGNKLFINYDGSPLDVDIPDCTYGYFIIVLTTGENFYSEIVNARDFEPNDGSCAVLEWYNDCDLGGIPYTTGYKNKIYLDLLLTNPKYPSEIEYVDEKTGNYRKLFSVLTKEYLAEIPDVPEYLADALSLIQLHNYFKITCKDTTIKAISSTFENDYPNSCFSKVELRIIVDEVVVNTNCCDNNELDNCYHLIIDNFDSKSNWDSGAKTTAEGLASIGDTYLIIGNSDLNNFVWTYKGGTSWQTVEIKDKGVKINANSTDMFTIDDAKIVYGSNIMSSVVSINYVPNNFEVKIQGGLNQYFDVQITQIGVGVIHTFQNQVLGGEEPIQNFGFNVVLPVGQNFIVNLINIGWHNGCTYNDTPDFNFNT